MQKKALDRTTHPFMIKTLKRKGIEENILKLIKNIYKKKAPTTKIILYGERMFSLKSGNRAMMPTVQCHSTSTGSSNQCNRLKKEKAYRLERKK